MKSTRERANRYYHKLKTDLAMYFGMNPEEVHEKLLIMFALVDVKEDRFEVESTTGMDSERLFLLIENIWQWVVENGIPLEHYTQIDEQTKIKTIWKRKKQQ